MCGNCVTTFDTMAMNLVGVTAAGSVALEGVRRRLARDGGLARRQQAWDENADLMRSMGLDPTEVLGARPGDPALRPEYVDVVLVT